MRKATELIGELCQRRIIEGVSLICQSQTKIFASWDPEMIFDASEFHGHKAVMTIEATELFSSIHTHNDDICFLASKQIPLEF